MVDNQLISRAIAISRFPLIVLVVLMHSAIKGDASVCPAGAESFIYYISKIFCRIAIPCFFFISGFLFFHKKDTDKTGFYKTQFGKRARRLLIPYFLWNTISLLERFIKTLPFVATYFPKMARPALDLSEVVNAYGPFVFETPDYALWPYITASSPVNTPLWYIRDLMALIIFTPFLYRLLKGRCGVFVCVGLLYCFISGTWPMACFWFNLQGVCFFCFGAWVAINKFNLIRLFDFGKPTVALSVWTLLLVAASVSRLLWRMSDMSMPLHAMTNLVGVPWVITLCAEVARRGYQPSTFISNATFFVYAFHGIMVSYVKILVIRIIQPYDTFEVIIAYFVIAFLLVVGPLMLYAALIRVVPGVITLLCHGRFRMSSQCPIRAERDLV